MQQTITTIQQYEYYRHRHHAFTIAFKEMNRMFEKEVSEKRTELIMDASAQLGMHIDAHSIPGEPKPSYIPFAVMMKFLLSLDAYIGEATVLNEKYTKLVNDSEAYVNEVEIINNRHTLGDELRYHDYIELLPKLKLIHDNLMTIKGNAEKQFTAFREIETTWKDMAVKLGLLPN